jgi:hypothetical protein
MDGMVNRCARSINVGMSTKPKMLRGLSQKALERVQSLANTLSWTSNAPGGQRAPHPCVSTLRNVVSPYCSSTRGSEAARPTNGSAGRGVGKSERHPVMGWIRVAPVVWATSPAAQAGRLPYGVSAREPRRNRYRRCGKWRWPCATGATFPVRASTSVSYRVASRLLTADGSVTRPLRCLSRMKGNFHVRF